MNGWKGAVLAAGLAGGAGLGAAVAPVEEAQSRARVQVPHVEVFSGGSRIGISIRDVDASGGKDSKGAAGVVVERVSGESPAQKAGFRAGDIIVEFDGERVRSARQLTRLVQETPAGRTVQATVQRDGQRTTVSVTPEEDGRFSFDRFEDLEELGRSFAYRVPSPPPVPARPGRPAPPVPPAPPTIWNFDDVPGGADRLGATVRSLSPQLAEYFGTKSGVLVSSVDADSASAKAGLKAGDVITSFNGTPIAGIRDVRQKMRELDDGEEFTIEVMRERKPVTLKGKAEGTARGRTRGTTL